MVFPQKELSENDIWTQLNHLEHKWGQAAQNNQALSDYISANEAHSNYLPIKERAMQLVEQHNQALKNAIIRST